MVSRSRQPLYQMKADFFKTLGHPARIRVLELLSEREHAVSEMLPEVGIEPANLSQQLSILPIAPTFKQFTGLFLVRASSRVPSACHLESPAPLGPPVGERRERDSESHGRRPELLPGDLAVWDGHVVTSVVQRRTKCIYLWAIRALAASSSMADATYSRRTSSQMLRPIAKPKKGSTSAATSIQVIEPFYRRVATKHDDLSRAVPGTGLCSHAGAASRVSMPEICSTCRPRAPARRQSQTCLAIVWTSTSTSPSTVRSGVSSQ